ncbi:MAG: metallophosphoesterase [Chloroherpetonaceae bacterium]|nr:metallophosphoesterase [Chloroherpetonaceae bacterium]
MPELTLLRIFLFVLLVLSIVFYLKRGFKKILTHFFPHSNNNDLLSLAIPIVIFSFPILSYLLRLIKPLRETNFIYNLLYFSSVLGIFTGILVAAFVFWDLLRILKRVFLFLIHLFRQSSPAAEIANQQLSIQPTFETNETDAFSKSRRDFLLKSVPASASLFFPSVITGYSLFNNRTNYNINRMTLHFPNLPAELRGLKIAQVSDIHSGVYMPQHKMEEITETVNSLSPDLVTLTGDFIAGEYSEIQPFVNGFKNLKSTYGTFSCPGNHDEWLDIKAITAAMNQKNLNLLQNEFQTLVIDGAPLHVIGMDFDSPRIKNFDEATQKLPSEGFQLLLCHHPDFFETAKKRNIDLMLAGHTHGGQLALDFPGLEIYPIDLFYKYPRGLYEEIHHKSQKLYVNLGIGITGTPLRTVQAEVALITLA